MYVCVLCSWNQTHLSTFGKETRSNTRMRWQKLHPQGTRPCCPLPGTWTVSPTARTGGAITRPTHRILRVCVCINYLFKNVFFPPAHYNGSFAVYGTLFFQYWHTGVRTLAQSYDYFIVLLLVWLRFYYLYCLTLDTHLKCHGVVCHSCATMCKPVEWIEENDLNVFLSENITV